jgi:diguanylate cyclase (GGDEF)-like protein
VQLKTRGFSNWEDRPHIFQFNNYAPLSNGHDYMYQNLVITPLKSLRGDISHVCLMIQDVSDIARNKMHLKASNQKLSTLSRTDGLTGLFNRAHWEACLVEQFGQLTLAGGNAALVIFDIDHFKKINDTYGHGAGDEVIRRVAAETQRTARSSDICGRYGGEEFTVLLPDTTADQALYFAERMRKRIERLMVQTEAGEVSFTISLGVSQFNRRFTSHQSWLEHADNALYQSKHAGRNQTTLAR